MIIKKLNPFTGTFDYLNDSKESVTELIIGAKGHFNTLEEAVIWFNTSATTGYSMSIDGDVYISDTITIDSPYNLVIKGSSNGTNKIKAGVGLTNKPLFICKSNLYFYNSAIDVTSLAGYGTLNTENLFNVGDNVYLEIQNSDINGGYNHFNFTGSDIKTYIFNNYLSNAVNCSILINSLGTTYLDTEVNTFTNCGKGINLLKSSNGHFDIMNNISDIGTGNIFVDYTGGVGNYAVDTSSSIIGNKWNNIGTFINGFDFTRSDGRDANIYIKSNAGKEDKTPHGYFEILDSTTLTRINTANKWTKAVWDGYDIVYVCKLSSPSVNTVVYQSINENDLTMSLFGSIETDTGAPNEASVCIVRNATLNANKELVTGEISGIVRVRIISNDDPVSFALVSYFEDTKAGDTFSIFVQQDSTDDLRITRLSGKIQC